MYNDKKILPVILSGGLGSRLWPLSRESHPKPFLLLPDGDSLLQKTFKRAGELTTAGQVVVVSNANLFHYSKDEIEQVDRKGVSGVFISEPVGRDTTAAISLAAHYAVEKFGPDCVLLVLPADHLIEDMQSFKLAVVEAQKLATSGSLVTFGIKPSRPETGYGYILASGTSVIRFVEKPDTETAEEYFAHGGYFWNSGMFCMSAGAYLSELSLYAPDIANLTKHAVANASCSSGPNWRHIEIQKGDFLKVPSISVDYSLFEKSKNVAIVQCDIGWCDLGSWLEFSNTQPADENGNQILGTAICQDTEGCVVHGTNRLIATLGIKDIIIVDTADAILVAHKDRAQDVRQISNTLKEQNHPSYAEFPTVHRPWGSYTVLQEHDGFKVKRIEVKPGAKLSLQSHKYRSEHWVVVDGVALVTNGDQDIELVKNQSTYIPLGNKHRLKNIGSEVLTIIEVQCGAYLGEDDIVRYDDIYGRQ